MSNRDNKEIYGLIGWPVKHSLSPAMQMAAFKALEINAEYRLFEIEPKRLEDFLLKDIRVKDTKGEEFSSKEIIGFNITIPHKIKAKDIIERGIREKGKKFPFDSKLPKVQEDLYYVKLSGAVNTVKRSGDKLEYWNTDANGFLMSLENDLKFVTKNKIVLVIGCGGAGRAVVAALSWRNIEIKKIYIYDVNKEIMNSSKVHFSQFQYIMDKLEFIEKEKLLQIIEKCNLLVNTSPVGMKEEDPSPLDKNLLHKNLYVYDVIYNRETQLIKDAKSLGLPVVGGLRMLLFQGIAAFEFWTEQKAHKDAMWQALLKETK